MNKKKNLIYPFCLVLFLSLFWGACSEEEGSISSGDDGGSTPSVTVPPISNLKAETTLKANELFIS